MQPLAIERVRRSRVQDVDLLKVEFSTVFSDHMLVVDWTNGINQYSEGSANLQTQKMAANRLSISERAIAAAKRVRDRGVEDLEDRADADVIAVARDAIAHLAGALDVFFERLDADQFADLRVTKNAHEIISHRNALLLQPHPGARSLSNPDACSVAIHAPKPAAQQAHPRYRSGGRIYTTNCGLQAESN